MEKKPSKKWVQTHYLWVQGGSILNSKSRPRLIIIGTLQVPEELNLADENMRQFLYLNNTEDVQRLVERNKKLGADAIKFWFIVSIFIYEKVLPKSFRLAKYYLMR